MSSYALITLDQHLQTRAGHHSGSRQLSRHAAERHAVLQALRERRTDAVRTRRPTGLLRRRLATRSGTSPA